MDWTTIMLGLAGIVAAVVVVAVAIWLAGWIWVWVDWMNRGSH